MPHKGLLVSLARSEWKPAFGFDNLKTPDINEDCIVDIYDMRIVSNAFGSKRGEPRYN